MLQAAADLADLTVPFLGINLGTLGFLAEVNKDDIEGALSKLIAGEFEIEKRMMLAGYVYDLSGSEPKDVTRVFQFECEEGQTVYEYHHVYLVTWLQKRVSLLARHRKLVGCIFYLCRLTVGGRRAWEE